MSADPLAGVASPAERALFRVLRGEVDGLDAEGWRAVCEVSLRTFVAPFLHARLQRRRQLDGLPDEVVTRLARSRAWSAARWQRSCEQVAELGEALGARGIRAMVLKGGHLGFIHEAAGARATGDVDLLVDQDHVEAARGVLEGLGYAMSAEEDWHEDHPDHRHLAPFHRRGGLPVELHWTLARRAEGAGWSEGVWERAVPWGGDGPMWGMEPTDALLYTCKHLAFHHLFNTLNGLAGLTDVEALLRRVAFDPREVGARADAWGIRSSVALCLALAEELLGAEVPPELAAAVAVEGIDEALSSAVWVLLHIGGFGLSRHLQLPSGATLNPPHPVFGLRAGRPVQRGFSFLRGAALPPVDDARLERPGWGRMGYPVLWGRLAWRHLGLLRLADPRVRAELRATRRGHRQRLGAFLGVPT